MTFAADIGRMVALGPKRQMTDRESMDMMNIAMMTQEEEPAQLAAYQEMARLSMSLKILAQRFEVHIGGDVKFSPLLFMWMATLADRPGRAVLLVAVLAHMHAEGGELTLHSLAESYFADGIPTEVNYQLAWDAQKVNEERLAAIGITGAVGIPDNLLDLTEAWK